MKRWAGWSTAGIKIAGRHINNLRYADDKVAEIAQLGER